MLSLNVVCSKGNRKIMRTGEGFRTLVAAEWIERMRRLCGFKDSAKLLVSVIAEDGTVQKLNRGIQLQLRNSERVQVEIDIGDDDNDGTSTGG